MYRLWPTKAEGEPLHVIGLGEWGYEPEVTGSVADLHWSPDERVLAVSPVLLQEDSTQRSTKRAALSWELLQVGWRRCGIGLWSASGCRLLCSLRQTPLRAPTPMGLTSAKLVPMTLEVCTLAYSPRSATHSELGCCICACIWGSSSCLSDACLCQCNDAQNMYLVQHTQTMSHMCRLAPPHWLGSRMGTAW